jgi:hypothetical protein
MRRYVLPGARSFASHIALEAVAESRAEKDCRHGRLLFSNPVTTTIPTIPRSIQLAPFPHWSRRTDD